MADSLESAGIADILDQLSISQKITSKELAGVVSDDLYFEAEDMLKKSHETDRLKCEKHAPFLFYVDGSGTPRLSQGCCNSWYCPRCSNIRARAEYGRIVNHARTLALSAETLFFITLTMRGNDLDRERMDDDYLPCTNRLLSTMRARSKKQGDAWVYVQVTERQKRGAAHSHIIATFCPDDVVLASKRALLPSGAYAKRETLFSNWLMERSLSAGLGRMCDISVIDNNIAVAVYVAKYLFKSLKTQKFPPHWRRVRYSHSWPKLPRAKASEAFPLVKLADWRKLEKWYEANGRLVQAEDEYAHEAALARLVTCVTYRGKLTPVR